MTSVPEGINVPDPGRNFTKICFIRSISTKPRLGCVQGLAELRGLFPFRRAAGIVPQFETSARNPKSRGPRTRQQSRSKGQRAIPACPRRLRSDRVMKLSAAMRTFCVWQLVPATSTGKTGTPRRDTRRFYTSAEKGHQEALDITNRGIDKCNGMK